MSRSCETQDGFIVRRDHDPALAVDGGLTGLSSLECDAMPNMDRQADAAAPAANFYCAEVWGGNRPTDRAIQLPGARGWVYSRPCDGGRGGDIHYVSLCSSGLISRVCLADVAGHGERIASASTTIHGLLRRYMNNYDQRRVLYELNRRMEKSDVGTMTTAVALTIFPPRRRISISYAGHPRAWLQRRSETTWQMLDHEPSSRTAGLSDMPLAIVPDVEFRRTNLGIRSGDRLLLITDGVLEAPAPSGEQFGEARLKAVLEANRRRGLGELVHAVLEALCDHTTCPEIAHDDVSLLLLEFEPGPGAVPVWHMLKRWLLRRPESLGVLE